MFQRFMHDAFCVISDFNIYFSNILVFTKSADKHLTHIESVLHRLHDKQLQAKQSKCEFLHSLVHFLGHIILG